MSKDFQQDAADRLALIDQETQKRAQHPPFTPEQEARILQLATPPPILPVDAWSVEDLTRPPLDPATIPEWTPDSDPNGVYHRSFSERQETRMREIIREEVVLILRSGLVPPQTTKDTDSSNSAA